MPATEQVWRSPKQMHVLFGVTSALMLATTIWMIADDHNRTWKNYQRDYFYKLERWSLETRIYETLVERFTKGLKPREALVEEESRTAPERAWLDIFVAELLHGQASEPNLEMATSYTAFADLVDLAISWQGQASAAAIDLKLLQADLEIETDAKRKEQLTRRIEKLTGELPRLEDELRRALEKAQGAGKGLAAVLRENGLSEGISAGDEGELVAALEKAAKSGRPKHREDFLESIREYVLRARFDEEILQRDLKFLRADLDVLRAELGIAIDQVQPQEYLDRLQSQIDIKLKGAPGTPGIEQLTLEYEAQNTFRKRLEAIQAAMNSTLAAAKKALDDYRTDLTRLETTLENLRKQSIAQRIVGAPILDAFDTSDIEIKQIWLPDLLIDYRHARVARFDRCTTCHLGIEKTQPGSATAPGYEAQRLVRDLVLKTPPASPLQDETPATGRRGKSKERELETLRAGLQSTYGFRLAEKGLWSASDPMVEYVLAHSPGAMAQLQRGDVIRYVNDVKVTTPEEAYRYLLERVTWGEPLHLTVERGVPQPFSTHPRLELLGGSTSPHPFAKFGCTICHEGQGSATDFQWASHTPNTLKQNEQWTATYGWFDNHHWEYPMLPKRFAQSGCLKCHHAVTELESSERFPESPAPKLVQGYHTIRQYGCFGCHEIRGTDGKRSIGPDLRLEPDYVPAAQALFIDPQLSLDDQVQRARQILAADVPLDGALPRDDEVRAWFLELQRLAGEVVQDPTRDASRRRLVEMLQTDRQRAEGGYLQPRVADLASALADVDVPGQLRKVGPSLRHVASKLEAEFLFPWIMEPKAFRPSTRMPQFFGLHSHFLPPENGNGSHAAGRQVAAAQGNGNGNGNGQAVNGSGEPSETELARTQRYEQAEALAITHYLLAVSRPVAYVTQSPEVTEDASAERGKYLFQTRGCLACHEHKDFPQGKESQGPDLSNIGSKLVTSKGRKWLYSWLRNPTHYSGRTLMPDLFLTPIVEKDGKITDPAADIALFLLESKAAFVPQRVPPLAEVEPTVYELAVEELRGVFPKQQAERYIEHGVPTDMAAELKGDEIELLGPTSDENRGDKTLRYLGRRAISKYGCFGCHDIPGFETAKPIGTGLADWGRKDASRLAFEQIARYVTRVHGSSRGGAHEGEEPHLDLLNMPPAQQDDALFLAALLGHKREGFLWQKLHEPRSFDYEKTRNKRYNERLRMPQFPFTEEQIESVMTFVLGLTADPPAEKFLYQPNPRQAAILEGQRVLEKYNCGGCHTLQHESFEFEYDPTFVSDQGFVDFASERKFPDNEYPFFQLHAAAEQIKQSQAVDARGLARARVFASRVVDENGEVQVGEDADKEGNEISLHFLQLWEPALINGQWWLTSDQVPVPANWFTRDGHRSAVGGSLARLIHPVVLATERQVNPAAKYADAWGFVPPPLVGEGQKVQTAWLHAFLLDPYPIRPATVLRMPRFNMTSAEAGAIVNYFAAKDKVEFPYEYDPRTRQAHLESRESAYPGRLDDALRIITNGNYCVKCHYVGDFVPAGAAAAHAPNLDRVYQRLRPEFLRNWLANPKRILPYTGMPVNFQLDKPLDPKLFAGDVGRLIKEGHSADQLEAVVDFLLNYDVYMKQQKSIKPLVTPAAPMTTPAAGG